MFTVTSEIHHGNYRETFTATDADLWGAVCGVAMQSSYTDRMTSNVVEAIIEGTKDGAEYRGYGWATFTVTEHGDTDESRRAAALGAQYAVRINGRVVFVGDVAAASRRADAEHEMRPDARVTMKEV